jgi:uncharacterized protein (TIGR03435 family)
MVRVAAGAVLVFVAATFGQSTAPLAFEVASIRPADSRQGIDMLTSPGGRLTATNCTLKQLIEAAYSLKPYQISGGPAWLDADRFDVTAKAPDNSGPDQGTVVALGRDAPRKLMLMLQTLLENRFGLKVRHETKQDTVYDLVVAKGGPKLKEANRDEQRSFVSLSRTGSYDRPAVTLIITGQKASMALWAERLSTMAVGRPVFDKTAIEGEFDFKFEYAADDNQLDAGPSKFTAIQEQLGLRLEAKKGPIETLVIDRAEKPSGN